jgi:arylsulfatase A-like enzyme
MKENQDDPDAQPQKTHGDGKIKRRAFIGALGASAVAGMFLGRDQRASAQESQSYYYQDSFGNVVPAGQGAVDLGVYPPPVPSVGPAPGDAPPTGGCGNGPANTTYYSCGYPKNNVLLIMVDQMRNPAFWLPTGSNWVSTYASVLPNLTWLAKRSFSFPNYWVAATVSGPSRACLQTGLYSQQTCYFKSGSGNQPSGSAPYAPPLLPYNNSWQPVAGMNINPGFPSIANVLSQAIPVGNTTQTASYDCTWIGKWHLSCDTGKIDGSPGQNGPSDYGYNPTYSIPTTNPSSPYPEPAYPSPNGLENEGTGGDFLDVAATSPAHDVPNFYPSGGAPPPLTPSWPGLCQLNDAAIAYAFTKDYLPYANTLATPFFCAVSFINPHDITDFPFPFGLAGTPGFGSTTGAAHYYEPPPMITSNSTYTGNSCGSSTACALVGANTTIPGFLTNTAGPYNSLPPGTGNSGPWNYESLSSGALQYGNHGKPGLQQYWLESLNTTCGGIGSPGNYNSSNNGWPSPTPWLTFLNYYLWMQSCVDYQIGQVLGLNADSNNSSYPGGLMQYPNLANNTVVIFTSDHGDYGGSHGLHAKGGGLYEEALNVPLLVSYPSMLNNSTPTGPYTIYYPYSSVDILPFLYELVLGNTSWRKDPNSIISYLSGREAIVDGIYEYEAESTVLLQQRRISGIPLHQGPGGCAVRVEGCAPWQIFQPFVLHTADDLSIANLGAGNAQPSHAIAFRTLDLTDPNTNPAPFAGQRSYGGGKLGIYSYWDTCDAGGAPIKGLNTVDAPNQYEFYNYSLHPYVGNNAVNPSELGNQYFDSSNTSGGLSALGQLYQNDFFNNSPLGGINIGNELYMLNNSTGNGNSVQQVAAATKVAFQNYRLYLECMQSSTGSTGRNATCMSFNNNVCPPAFMG